MVCEVKVALTTEDGKYTKKHLVYEPFTLSIDDETIKQLVHETVSECKAVVEAIKLTVKMEVQ